MRLDDVAPPADVRADPRRGRLGTDYRRLGDGDEPARGETGRLRGGEGRRGDADPDGGAGGRGPGGDCERVAGAGDRRRAQAGTRAIGDECLMDHAGGDRRGDALPLLRGGGAGPWGAVVGRRGRLVSESWAPRSCVMPTAPGSVDLERVALSLIGDAVAAVVVAGAGVARRDGGQGRGDRGEQVVRRPRGGGAQAGLDRGGQE